MKEQYKTRLREFNATQKYKSELDFLCRLMAPVRGEKILDYGCGTGTAVRHINENYGEHTCFGYDVNNYRDQDDAYLFRNEYFFKFNKVFFMHSIAHVPDIGQKLMTLKELLLPEAKVYVVTPNLQWLSENAPDWEYKPDTTVIDHFDSGKLACLFSEAGYKINSIGQFGSVTGTRMHQHYINERLFLEAIV